MLELSSPVNAIPKIGSRYKFLLSKLNINTVGDLLHHFPSRYEDFSQTKKIKDIQPGETITLEVTLLDAQNIFTRNHKKLTVAKVEDKTGSMKLVWFNQHYIKAQLLPGLTYRFSGKVTTYQNKLSMYNPRYEIEDKEATKTGKLIPVYPETEGIASTWLASRINDVLTQLKDAEELGEYLPKKLVKDKNFPEYKYAIKAIHFPSSNSEMESAKARLAFEELFLELLKVEYRKNQWSKKTQAPAMQEKPEVEKFIETLPFTLTKSQQAALQEILADLQTTQPMNRLLEGDVGTGKTIVAIIAAYLAYLNGYKTIYMAPTEILANQHYKTFKTFLANTYTDIKLVTGTKKAENLEETDIIVGTHALLFQKELADVGLIIIDEQHRFGVEQRTQVLRMHKSPHLLTMTATPIPRTLALTLYGDLDISVLKETPNKTKKITTKVIPEKLRQQAYSWIKAKGEPTFIVCPLIEESENEGFENIKAATAEFETLRNGTFKDVQIGLLHGKMKAKEKQEVIERFKNGKLQILVSTPVIEVGIDVPEASVMVIESAERYGLASLHQLRGRVGRGDKEGFCFVFMSSNSRAGYARLKHLETISEGLKLAEIDMATRGQGDIYGVMQHGFKEFKLADIQNLELLEEVKLWAHKIFPDLDKYPRLKRRVEEVGGNYASNN